MEKVTVFAPATVANVGPGFDVLGVAVEGLGDVVTARRLDGEPGQVRIEHVEGDGGRLPRAPEANTAGIAARATLALLGVEHVGVGLALRKGLPLNSGLGSSGASAAAACWAVNLLFGAPLDRMALLPAALEAEARVSGRHADNVGPALLGGFVLIHTYDPLELIRLPVPDDLLFVLAVPECELPTHQARQVLPANISLQDHVTTSGHLAALVAGICTGNTRLVGRAIRDPIVEPARAPLIPGFAQVKRAALDAGAHGCSISGAGPTLFAVTDGESTAQQVAQAMKAAFADAGLASHTHIGRVDRVGARLI
ncbi:MAG: homoserine kinase [Ardenticatenia bacterium]|nr:homoserine kinase [Ardenticatenia bacterium]